MAYLTAAKQLAIKNQMREDEKTSIATVLSETAAAIAAHKSATIAGLALNASPAYVEAEVQSIADKLDAVIAALKAAGLMA